MADITQILNQRMSRYERERARLVEEYVTAAWKMWQINKQRGIFLKIVCFCDHTPHRHTG